ncbi:hypothetical protein ACFE04_001724 [Oxalis oulophora]
MAKSSSTKLALTLMLVIFVSCLIKDGEATSRTAGLGPIRAVGAICEEVADCAGPDKWCAKVGCTGLVFKDGEARSWTAGLGPIRAVGAICEETSECTRPDGWCAKVGCVGGACYCSGPESVEARITIYALLNLRLHDKTVFSGEMSWPNFVIQVYSIT